MASLSIATCIADSRSLLGEGPVWVDEEQALYWVDIKGRRLHRHDWASKTVKSWPTPFRIGAIAPRAGGGFVAGTEHGFAFVDPERDQFEVIADPEPDRPANRFNDGKLDRDGRFWAGTMDDSEQVAQGALYRLDPDMRWHRIDDGYRVTNGPAFSPGGRLMYHTDSARQTIYVFDLGEGGEIGDREVFARFGEGDGYPDGMTVDAQGCLWVAFWDGWCLRRFAPSGECLEEYDMPVQRPTSCVFGGPDLDHLFVTSARIGLDLATLTGQPQAGGLFVLKPDVTGLVTIPFPG